MTKLTLRDKMILIGAVAGIVLIFAGMALSQTADAKGAKSTVISRASITSHGIPEVYITPNFTNHFRRYIGTRTALGGGT